MSEFTAPLIVESMPDGRRWRLVDKFAYHVGSYPSGFVIEVPTGFMTDFASVPWMFWWLIPPTGRYGKACVIHDFMLKNAWATKKVADAIFYEAMLVLGVGKAKAYLMYTAVRIFGKGSYGITTAPLI